ncbi:alpha/beta hydrolase [Ochrobactrum sp. GPK 3]|uniref:alpha/beta fold hydrolase n=1 Tax=Brucella sp. 22210 TaxID=3453892 RepID=UPI00313854F2
MSFQPAFSSGIAYLERKGPGPVLVCLHGIGSNAQSFDALLPCLPDDWHVVAWNVPGYSGSAPLSIEWPIARDYAMSLKGLTNALSIRKINLFAHSLGTLIAASFAVSYPNKVSRMMLASCALGHGVKAGGSLSEQAQARLTDLAESGPQAFAAKRAARLVHRPEEHPLLVERIRNTMSKVSNPGYTQAVRMLASGKLVEDCLQLTIPTSVLTGSDDQITPPKNSQSTYSAIPNAQRRNFVSLANAGHAVYQQAPKEVANFIISEVGGNDER